MTNKHESSLLATVALPVVFPYCTDMRTPSCLFLGYIVMGLLSAPGCEDPVVYGPCLPEEAKAGYCTLEPDAGAGDAGDAGDGGGGSAD
jgi:hypothetical protein